MKLRTITFLGFFLGVSACSGSGATADVPRNPGAAVRDYGFHVAEGRVPSRIPVAVMLVDSVPAGTPAILLRRAEGTPPDVILLPTSTDVFVFTAAIERLLEHRRIHGDTVASATRSTLRESEARFVRALPWAPRVLRDLRSAPARVIPGVGSHPAVQVWLPRQSRS